MCHVVYKIHKFFTFALENLYIYKIFRTFARFFDNKHKKKI